MNRLIFILFFCIYSSLSLGQMVDTFPFHDESTRQRAQELAKVLRCPQCQNQNLLESNADVAAKLRHDVFVMVNNGATDQEVIVQMQQRFGDFVLYDPPFTARTWWLWGLPLAAVVFLLGYGWFYHRAKPHNFSPAPTTYNLSPNKRLPAYWLWAVIFACILLASSLYFMSPRFQKATIGQAQTQAKKNEIARNSATQNQQKYIELLQDELRQNRNDAAKWIALGQAYMAADAFDNALTAYSYAERLTGSTPTLLGLAATASYYLHHEQNNPQTDKLLQAALAKDPNEINSLSLLAHIAFTQKDYTRAIHLWQKILDTDNEIIDRRQVINRIKVAQFLMGKHKS